MKARGSAIIIAMLLITAVGSIAFGISRVIYIESASASTYVNGAIAYYAAESGLEEGFLRYRYNQNAEVPFSNWYLNNSKIYRSDLSAKSVSTGTSNAGIDPTVIVSDPSKQSYDLRMGYLGTYGEPFYGHDAIAGSPYLSSIDAFNVGYGTGDYSFVNVNKDESIKLDLSNVDLVSQHLILSLMFPGAELDKCHATAEVKFEVKDLAGNTQEYKALTSHDRTGCAATLGVATSNLIAADADNNSNSGNFHYLLSNIFTNMLLQYGKSPTYSVDQKITMFIKPLYYDAKIGLITSDCSDDPNACKSVRNKIVTGPYSSIKTTGYYGGTTRKLEANIDRQSGTLYDLFDYVIYKAS